MARVITCASCQQPLSLPSDVAPGKQVRCPSCQAISTVPSFGPAPKVPRQGVIPARPANGGSTHAGRPLRTDPLVKPIATPPPVLPRPRSVTPVVMVKPKAPEVVEDDEEIRPKKKKKSKKTNAMFHIGGTPISRGVFFGLLGMLLFVGTVITLILVYVPFGKMFAGTPEAQIVDVYTAINGMGYNNVGVRVMNSDAAAYCIPGPRKIMITRANPNGKYLLLRLKVPYSDVDKFFSGVRDRIYLNRGHIQVEANGSVKDAMFIQDENAENGYYQMSYQPPMQENSTISLRDYLGPKAQGGWTTEGKVKEYEENFTFESNSGMQVKISVGAQRQDGGGGNILESLTGKKILGNQQGLVGGVSGFVYVEWNQGSGGHIVHSDLEQPNEIGLNWNVNCICELPEGASKEVTLKVLGKSRKIKIQ